MTMIVSIIKMMMPEAMTMTMMMSMMMMPMVMMPMMTVTMGDDDDDNDDAGGRSPSSDKCAVRPRGREGSALNTLLSFRSSLTSESNYHLNCH